jgi:hypothetical protein
MLFPVRCLALVLSSRGLGEIWQCMSRHPQTCIQLAQLYTLLFSTLRCVSFLNRCLPAVCSTMSTLTLRFMVNCEQILSCYMSKALLKTLGLCSRSITWIDLVTRVKLHHLHMISGFHSVVDEPWSVYHPVCYQVQWDLLWILQNNTSIILEIFVNSHFRFGWYFMVLISPPPVWHSVITSKSTGYQWFIFYNENKLVQCGKDCTNYIVT